MITLRNKAALRRQISNWIDTAEQEAAQVATGLAVTTFNNVLYASPQKSADFVSNWKYSQNRVDTTFTERGLVNLSDSKTWFLKGALQGILLAKSEQSGREKGFKLGGSIFISNSAKHNNQPYAQKIESGEIKFRPGNSGAPLMLATGMLDQYTLINKNQARRLMGKRIGA